MAKVYSPRTVVGTVVDVYAPREVGKENATVVNFTVAITSSYKDGDEWADLPTEFVRCTAWRGLADNVVESFNKGDRIIVIGQYKMDKAYTNGDGEEVEGRATLHADFVGVDITYDAAHSEREAKNKTTAQSDDEDEAPRKSKSSSKGKASNPSKSKPAAKKAKKEENIFDDEDDVFGDDDDDDDIFS